MVNISDLDDNCLLRIFGLLNPLPDLFNVARTSRRFSDLITYGRKSLLVSASAIEEMRFGRARGMPRRYVFATLEEAIAASRPGDTIALEGGEEHQVSECVIPWPLHLKGRGRRPEDTVLLAGRGSAGLLFKASGKLANLSVKTRRAACVVHHRGRLVLEDCMLECKPEGLDHLFAPLVTLAYSRSPKPPFGSSARQPAVAAQRPFATRLVPAAAPRRSADAESGTLLVSSSKIKGGRGSVAVHTLGTGSLRNVRVITRSADTLYWFEVDSAVNDAALSPSSSPQAEQLHGPQAGGERPQLHPGVLNNSGAAEIMYPATPGGVHTAGACPFEGLVGGATDPQKTCGDEGPVPEAPWVHREVPEGGIGPRTPQDGESHASRALLRSKLWRAWPAGAVAGPPPLPAPPPPAAPPHAGEVDGGPPLSKRLKVEP
eukprot:jgi/Botrbrau1/8143/Bobra.0308s0033.1